MVRNNIHIDESDAIELAAHIMGSNPDDATFNEDACITAFEERFGIDMDTFAELATELAKFTTSTKSPLTGRHYKGFVLETEGRYIAKISAD